MTKRRRLFDFASPAFTFVFTLGVVNLFADVTYEGGGSLNGQFLAALGATAAATSFVAGLGEFLGYAVRAVSGHVADRTGRYWALTFLGYVVNLLAVPALAVAGSWPAAAVLMLAERVGRGIRKPTVEAMLSYTTGTLGRGWVYALNTALDETGATVGPLLMALVLWRGGTPRVAFAWLAIPAFLAIVSLAVARRRYPLPARLEEGPTATVSGFGTPFRLFAVGAALFAAGLLSFELIGFHFASTGAVSPGAIPVLLALATAGGVAANLVLGRLYDRFGVRVVFGAVAAAAGAAPLIFLGGRAALVAGMMLWGVGYAVQDTLFKAIVAGLLPKGKRGLAFGLFYAGYGVGWLVGGIVAGLLYERSIGLMVGFSVAAELSSIPVLALASRAHAAP
ncbi:MAG TPA: MFS transporter [Thermoanaerobaculia bacterium]|nr:MFS transporter [Thermoanaerobaculia bacterium]